MKIEFRRAKSEFESRLPQITVSDNEKDEIAAAMEEMVSIATLQVRRKFSNLANSVRRRI
jgi:hypothetical protein